MTKHSILDRIVLYRHEILRTTDPSRILRVFHTTTPDCPVVLKFAHAGKVQYHKLSASDAQALLSELRDAEAVQAPVGDH